MKTQTYGDGLIRGDYFAFDAVNASRLKLARKSLAHYFSYQPPATTAAMEFGTLFHAAILEPHILDTDFFIMEKYDRRTKDGKEAHAAQEEAAQGRQIVTPSDMEMVKGMQDSLAASPAWPLMDGEGVNELALTAVDPISGLTLKCKVDRLCYGKTGALIPVDLKTTTDASREGFIKACTSFDYAIQAAFYDKILKLVYPGQEVLPMRFIMIEKDAPHHVGQYQVGEFDMAYVRDWIDATLLMISTTTQETCPPAYYDAANPMGLHIVDLPKYYTDKLQTL